MYTLYLYYLSLLILVLVQLYQFHQTCSVAYDHPIKLLKLAHTSLAIWKKLISIK